MVNTRNDSDLNAETCPFCKIVSAEDTEALVVYRDANCVALFPDEPATLGHTLVIPRIHVADIWGLSKPTADHLTQATLKVASSIRRVFRSDALNIIQSNGPEATQTVFHLHIHLVPRYPEDHMGPIWPTGSTVEEDSLAVAAERLTMQLYGQT